MKKVVIGTVIVALSIAVVVMAMKLRRLSPPEQYEYSFRNDIDADYYDQKALKDYYATGYAVGSFAREMWNSRGINVRFPASDNASEQSATLHYNSMQAYADSLGARMARSKQLKTQGLSNREIRLLENSEMTLDEVLIAKSYGGTALLKGERSTGMRLLQGQLISLGYVIPSDGYFWIETETAIKDFQSKNGLPVMGTADIPTLKVLLKAAPIKTH